MFKCLKYQKCHATERQTIQAGTPCITVCIHGITRYLSPSCVARECEVPEALLDSRVEPRKRPPLSLLHGRFYGSHAWKGLPDNLMLYGGILLRRKERHTELHVSKAIISRLYFPVSAVHRQPTDLPKCAYLNWPSLNTKKMPSWNV